MSRAITQAFILIVFLGIATPTTWADIQSIQLGNVKYSGSACPAGSVTTFIEPATAQIHIHFNQYIVEAHGRNQGLRKTCQLSIPIKVPNGVSISLVSAEYNGKVALPTGGQARIMNAYSFSGRRGMRFKTEFQGPSTQGYSLHDPLSSFASVWSPCGQDTVLRVTTSTRIKTRTSNHRAYADSQQGFVTQLRYRSCQ